MLWLSNKEGNTIGERQNDTRTGQTVPEAAALRRIMEQKWLMRQEPNHKEIDSYQAEERRVSPERRVIYKYGRDEWR